MAASTSPRLSWPNRSVAPNAWVALMGTALVGGLISTAVNPAAAVSSPAPEARALAFLTREVPLWREQNGCFSCHNNGDGARALYTAVRHARDVPEKALSETTRWLADPDKWDENKGDPAVSDKGLARIQFAAALTAAVDAGAIAKQERGSEAAQGNQGIVPLIEAAEMLVRDQQQDGSWRVDSAETIGSPVTYGPVLATYLARRTLEAARRPRFRAAIDKANQWLRGQEPRNVLDAAAVLMAFEGKTGPDVGAQRKCLLKLLADGQSRDGGWGPYVTAPPESFDTAVALLALVTFRFANATPDATRGSAAASGLARVPAKGGDGGDKVDIEEMIARGRRYLIARQLSDGSWPETTRPSGSESYAQRLSTTAWATMALLATAQQEGGGF